MPSALETALLAARRCDSYIEGFALQWSVAEFAFDPTGGIPLEVDKAAAARVEKQARHIFESFMRAHNVPRQRFCHSAGWTTRHRVRTSSAATAAFSTRS